MGLSAKRFYNHLALLWISASGCYLAYRYRPANDPVHTLIIGTGYTALILIVATLVIGPIQLMRQRRNPVNIYLRRDIGIWAGITGCLHVFFGLQLHDIGILSYFLRPDGSIMWNLFGQANYAGLAATFVLIVLLITSNDIALKALKGKRWKLIQRFNYLLFVLSMLHTVLYQEVARREPAFAYLVAGLIVFTLALQAAGLQLYRAQQRRA